MRYSNLHTHTCFSDGKHTPEENILSAIDKNMLSLGFSDHSYTDFDLHYCLRPVAVPTYIREIRRLQKKYENQIQLYLGLECDGFSPLENRELYDYIIGDCHYIKIGNDYFAVDESKTGQTQTIQNHFHSDSVAYARAYFDTYVDSIQKIRPDILGHIDLCSKFNLIDETSPVYQKLAVEALLACLEVTPLIELNTGAISRKARSTPYPADFLLKEVLVHKGKILLNSDSHDKEHLDFYFDESVELLKMIGFKSIVQLHNGQFEEVGI